jgi:deoxyribonuclease-4
MRLGFHLSIAGSLLRALNEASVLGCQALQIFIQNPRSWKWRQPAALAIRDFTAARRRLGLGPLVVHLNYLPNLAAADPQLYALSSARLASELALARDLEADYLVVHPGHAEPAEGSLPRVAEALNRAVLKVPPPPLVLLENTAGQGRELGWRLAQLAEIMTLSGVPLGLCLDTAHAWGAGYDLTSFASASRLLAAIARGPGLDRLKVIHLNDSKAPLGSRRDRHAQLGLGTMGVEGLKQFFSHPWLKAAAAILETPRRHRADAWRNLLTARSLVAGPPLLAGGQVAEIPQPR